MGLWTGILTRGQDLKDSQEKKVGVSAESWMTESVGERVRWACSVNSVNFVQPLFDSHVPPVNPVILSKKSYFVFRLILVVKVLVFFW